MDNILYVLLLASVFILGIANSEDICNGDNCNSTEKDPTSEYKIETDIFGLNSDLSELHMDGCSYLSGVLEVTPKLRTLEIFNCSWYKINMTQLSVVPRLTTLRMQRGGLMVLDSNQFVDLPRLEILELGENDIRLYEEDTFTGLSKLWMLTLNNNKLGMLPENFLYPLPELRHLDLSNNRIFTLPKQIFAHSPKLQVFFIRQSNCLRLLPESLAPLRNLIFLDLSYNFVGELQLPGAESISLENSHTHNLRVNGKVSKLQAGKNDLTNLHFKYKEAVTELALHENRLDSGAICNIVQGMWRLQRLDISNNLLKELPICQMEHLGEVFLLLNLRFVNMSRNMMTHLRADSPLLSPSLTHLDLSHNGIRSIEPHTFSMASKIESLHIQGNHLVYFQPEVFHYQHRGLKEVALYYNNFHQDIYEKIAKYFVNAGVLVLEENPEAVLKMYTSNNDTFHAGMLIRLRYEPGRRQSAELNIFKKWSTWNVLILLCLLAALTLNVILIIQHLRSSGKRAWRRKQTLKIKSSFLNRKI